MHIDGQKRTKELEDIGDTVTFIEKTKNGEYAEIETTSLEYLRMEVQSENPELDHENLIYSVHC